MSGFNVDLRHYKSHKYVQAFRGCTLEECFTSMIIRLSLQACHEQYEGTGGCGKY